MQLVPYFAGRHRMRIEDACGVSEEIRTNIFAELNDRNVEHVGADRIACRIARISATVATIELAP
jgi:hypothetical protein